MQNGTRLLAIRILSSACLTAIVLLLAAWLIHCGYEVPAPWWGIGAFAIGGVVGADIIAAYFTKGAQK